MSTTVITTKPIQAPGPEPKRSMLDHRISIRELMFFGAVALCLTPVISPPLALLTGLIVAQVGGHPYLHLNHRITQWLLQASVVLLGFGMDLNSAVQAGATGVPLTVASIAITLLFGILLGRWLRMDRSTAYLIAVGTAICGGSAIAALSPLMQAKEKQLYVSLGTVFILNSAALLVFPLIGSWLHLMPDQFGLWCALAIHDTSSVVGAAAKFGPEALQVATTVKLARALWIIPVAVGTAAWLNTGKGRIRLPYFIGLFILAMIVHTYLPAIEPIASRLVALAHHGLTLTLFLIGAGLPLRVIRAVGWQPLAQGFILWMFISAATLAAILYV